MKNFDPVFKEAAKKVLALAATKDPQRSGDSEWSNKILRPDFQQHDIAEAVIKATGVPILWDENQIVAQVRAKERLFGMKAPPQVQFMIAPNENGAIAGDAAYHMEQNVISMPDRRRFPRSDYFYSTMFHELGHWTGHKDRLARPFVADGDNGACHCEKHDPGGAAQEEVTAEMTAVMCCAALGMNENDHSAGYIANWLQKKEAQARLGPAIRDARAAAHFLLNKV